MKRLTLLVQKWLTICLFLIAITPSYASCIDGIYYRLGMRKNAEGVFVTYAAVTYYSLTSNDSAYYGCIVIPSSVGSKPSYGVKDIGKKAFNNCIRLSSVSIPNSVTTIADSAFWGCSSLTAIEIPNSVTKIGKRVFLGCTSLDSVVVTCKNPTAVDANAFEGISDKAILYVPHGTKSLYENLEGWKQFITIKEALTDGSVFTASTPEGVDMRFRVIDEENKTAEVYGGYAIETASSNKFRAILHPLHPAISDTVSIGITIPEVIDGYKVVALSNRAFLGCKFLPSITIPESVKNIGISAFYRCSNLTNISIPNSMTSIEMYTFSECSNLTNVSIPHSITSIGDEAFAYCRSLSSITIPKDVAIIGERVFYNCSKIETITVDSLNPIYDSRENCNSIIRKTDNKLIVGCKNSFIPNSVTAIGYSAFSHCTSLTSINIPNECTEIDAEAFVGCTNLTFINISEKCSTIGDKAFSGCENLLSITIPKNIKSIGTRAFSDCSSLDSVTSLSMQPITIEANTFERIPKDAVLYVPSGSKSKYENLEGWNQFKIIEEILIDGSTFTALTEEGVEMEYRVISASEKTCEVSRLTDYRTEGEITIPSEVNSFQVTAIGESAFVKCSNITSVKVPNTITKIGSLAFAGCSNLSAIKLPNSITTIGYGAFEGCENLKSIVIPSSVTTIECLSPTGSWGNPFQFCSSLERIVVESGNTVYDSRDNCNAIIQKSGEYQDYYKDFNTLIAGCKSTVVPSSVEEIGNYAFAGTGLTHIEIPNNIQAIGNNAFYGNYVEKDEFVCYSSLDPANFGYWGCTILDTSTDDGFYISNGKLLKYTGNDSIIVIPEIVTSISDYVFSGRADITSVTIPDKVMSIGYGAFLNCSSLKSVNIPSGVTVVNDNTFNGCTALSSLDLPKSLSTIGNFAFSGCSSLKSITFPESLNRIGSSAFQGCESLTEVYCYRPACPETGNDVFLDSNISNATLWVLETSYDLYKNTAPWSDFGNILTKEVATVNPSNFTFTATTAEGVPMRFRIIDSVSRSAEVYGYYVSRTATLEDYYPAISQNVSKVTIPASVITNYGEYNITSISSDAFYNCNVNTLTIPSSIKSISYDAFKGCTNLKKVIIPDIAAWCSVKFELYKNSSFRDNSPLTIGSLYSDEKTEITNLVIPNGVTAINDYAFYYCKNLTSVKISKSVTSIGKNAFVGCSGLQKVIVPDIAAWCSVSFASFMDNPISQCHYLYSDDNTEITELTIPENVTHIAPYAFYDCSNIKKFTIPDGLLSIGEDAFPYPKSTVNLYFYCNTGTSGLLAVWNYLSELSKRYDQKAINLQSAYDLQDRNTKLLAPSLSVNTTQTTATIKISGIYDGYYYTLNNKPLETDEMTRIGLNPGYSEDLVLRVTLPNTPVNSVSFICKADLKTKTISPSTELVQKSASSLSVTGTYNHGDAIITKETLAICNNMTRSEYADNSAYCSTYNPNATNRSDFYSNYYLAEGTENIEGSAASYYGLNPSTGYYVVYNVFTDSKAYTSVQYVTTDTLVLNTLQPKVISTGNVIVAAESNLDDNETNIGFEWRRIDWTDDFASNTGGAYLYERKMEGYIRNMYTEKLWKYRPYYESNSGNRYYGDWVGIDPTNTSYFEPTVYTYSTNNVSDNTAEVKGYAMRGTDNITSQGFLYWKASPQPSSKARENHAPVIPANAKMVEAKGNVMIATLENLDYDTEYRYVAFVTTSEGETFYGEEQTFWTGMSQDMIDKTESLASSLSKSEGGIYDLQGRKLSVLQKGINIIRMSDGTVRKVMIK